MMSWFSPIEHINPPIVQLHSKVYALFNNTTMHHVIFKWYLATAPRVKVHHKVRSLETKEILSKVPRAKGLEAQAILFK